MVDDIRESDEYTRVRAVLAEVSASDTRVVALTISAGIERLLAADWPERAELLRTDDDLVDGLVARALRDRDLAASLFVQRAVDVGVPAAIAEVGILIDLAAAVPSSARQTEVLVRIAADMRDGTGMWALPLLSRALGAAAAPDAGPALRATFLFAAAATAGVSEGQVRAVLEWTRLTPGGIEARLRGHQGDFGVVALAAEVAGGYAAAFGLGTENAAHDIGGLFLAARDRNADAAVEEYHMILRARAHIESVPVAPADLGEIEDLLTALLVGYEDAGAVWLLHPGVALGRSVLPGVVRGHPRRAELASLVSCLVADLVERGDRSPDDLREALALAREALSWCDEHEGSDEARARYESNLGYRISLAVVTSVLPASARKESLELLERALARTPRGDSHRAWRLARLSSELGEAVWALVRPPEALLTAVEHARAATALVAANDPDRPDLVMFECNAVSRAVTAGVLDVGELTEAITEAEAAVAATPQHHPGRISQLANLGGLIGASWRAGHCSAERLRVALEHQEAALAGTAADDPYRASRLDNLAARITDAVDAGIVPAADIVRAIELGHEAVTATREGHPDHAGFVANLSASVFTAVRIGVADDDDLGLAAELARYALDRTPKSHAALRASRAAILAAVLSDLDEPEYLPEALERAEEAVALASEDDPDYGMYLSTLSSTLVESVRAGIVARSRLSEALRLARKASERTPLGHPAFHVNLSDLAVVLVECAGEEADQKAVFTEAIACSRTVIATLPMTDPDRARCVTNLGLTLREAIRYEAVSVHAAAAIMIELVDDFWIWARHGAPSPDQRRHALAASEGLIAVAVPLVAVGIGAAEAIRVAEAVRQCLIDAREAPSLPPIAGHDHTVARYRQAAAGYRRAQKLFAEDLADARDTTAATTDFGAALDEIRRIPQLADFGSRPTISELTSAMDPDSRAIYLVPHVDGGIALVLDPDGVARRLDLPGFDEESVVGRLEELLESADSALDLAGWLWTTVSEPLLAEVGTDRPLVMVPTGHAAMLPLHAAGDSAGYWLDDLVELRILPTLRHLSASPGAAAYGAAVIAVSDARDLPFLAGDRAVARALLCGPVISAGATGATVDRTLTALAEANAAILGGHAHHDLDAGGCLALDDGVLTAAQLDQLPRRDRSFAVVMACSSGQVAARFLDETVGLPAALLRAGFRGVCASMWPVDDPVAFLTLGRLLQVLATETDRPVGSALRDVRRWLRAVTVRELRVWFAALHRDTGFDDAVSAAFDTWLAVHGPRARPMRDPVHWAAFAHMGR